MLLKSFISTIAVMVAFPIAVFATPQGNNISVCDFARQISKLNGQIVSVRGIFVMDNLDPDLAAPDYLIGTCPDIKAGMIKVKIDYPDVWFLKKAPQGFHMDKGSFLRAHKVIMKTLRNGKIGERYIATIRGQAYSSLPASAPPPGLHVTREGAYDAGIVIEGMYDTEIPAE